MTDDDAHRGASRFTARLAIAAGIIPVMLILPMYIFPVPMPGTGVVIGGYDGRRLIQIAWAALLVVGLLRPGLRQPAAAALDALPVSSRVVAGLFLGWALLSALVSAAPPYALREWGLLLLLCVTVFPLLAILGEQREGMVSFLGLTLLLYAILILPSPLETGFGHPRFLGQALAVAIPVLLFSGNRVLAIMAAPALGFGILNGSRALVVTLLAVTVAAWLLWPERARRMLPGLAGLALAVLVVGLASFLGAGSELQAAVERGTHSTGRYQMWADALARFRTSPLLGVGPGLLAQGQGLAGVAAHPHNTVLLVLAETGVIGLVLAATLALQALWKLPSLPSDRRPWALGLIGGGIHSLFSGTVIMPASQCLLVVVLALALPGPRPRDPAREPSLTRAGWVLAVLGLLGLGLVLTTLSLPPGGPPSRGIWGPRFFLRGLIP